MPPGLDQLREGVLKVFDLKGQIDANNEECDQLIERVKVLTDGIIPGSAQSGAAQVSPGLRGLDKVVQDINKYLLKLKNDRVFVKAAHGGEISRQLGAFNKQLDDAHRRYQADISLSQTTSLSTHTSMLDAQTDKMDRQISTLNMHTAALDTQTRMLSSVISKVERLTVSRNEKGTIDNAATPTYIPIGDIPPKPQIVVGREDEYQAVLEVLRRPKSSHIAILGSGGIGKTTLILQILHDALVEQRFSDRRSFVKCDGVVSAEGVVAAVASQFNVTASEGLSVQTALIHHLRSCRQPILLVLDNLESAWDTDDQELVEAFLTGLCDITSLSLIITMRGTRSPDGQEWIPFEPLGPLRQNHARELFLRLCGRSKAQRDPRLNELLDLLDGLPLAITLLASIGKSGYSPSELLADYKQEKTSMLAKGRANNRLSSLEISIELSLRSRTLQDNPDALTLLGIISLLPDGIDEDDIPAVFPTIRGFKRPARILHQAALCTHRDGVYRVLAPIRTYMLEHLEHRPAGTHLDELRDFYIHLVIQARRAVSFTAVMRNRLTSQMSNAQSVLTHAMRAAVDPKIMLEAVEALGYLSYMTHSGSCTSLLQDATATYAKSRDPVLLPFMAACRQVLGNMLAKEADYERAKIELEEAKLTFEHIGYRLSAAQCTQSLGNISQVFLGIGDRRGAAQCTKRLGDIQRFEEDYTSATATLQEAMSEFLAIGEPMGVAECLHGLGGILLSQGDYEGATAALDQAQSTFREYGDRLGVAQCMQDLGEIFRLLGNCDGSAKVLEDARVTFRELGDKHGVAGCTYSLGTVLQTRGDHDAAVEAFEEARGMLEEMGTSTMWGVKDCDREIDRTVRSKEIREVCFAWCGREEDEDGKVIQVYDLPEPPEKVAAVRHLAWCDACREEIVGMRYKCLDCTDFDLCEACLLTRNEHHPRSHCFAELDRQTRLIVQRTPDVQQSL